MDLLDEALENWEFAREGVIDEVSIFADKDLAFRPAAGSRTAAELVFHILISGALMSGELSREDGDFRRKSYDALLKEHGRGIHPGRTRRALGAALRKTHRAGARKIRTAGEVHMLQQIRRFDGKLGTRLAWMHHGIGHEEYHRAQLALYSRIIGKTPALTRKIEG